MEIAPPPSFSTLGQKLQGKAELIRQVIAASKIPDGVLFGGIENKYIAGGKVSPVKES
jgi:hypothetical protein